MYDVTLKNRVQGINWSTAAWHNNHHAHPTAARHGLAWYEIESTGGEFASAFFGMMDTLGPNVEREDSSNE
jgi:fatty-acid desaturase